MEDVFISFLVSQMSSSCALLNEACAVNQSSYFTCPSKGINKDPLGFYKRINRREGTVVVSRRGPTSTPVSDQL